MSGMSEVVAIAMTHPLPDRHVSHADQGGNEASLLVIWRDVDAALPLLHQPGRGFASTTAVARHSLLIGAK